MPDEPRTAELAHARSVRVLETNVLHSSDVIYWLDGTTAETQEAMTRIRAPLEVVFSQKPRAVETRHGAGKTAFWRPPEGPMVAGRASESERERPAQASFTVAGRVQDPAGRYNPRRFDLTLGDATGAGVPLYPSPMGAPTPVAGALYGSLRWADGETPLPWALLELTVVPAAGDPLTFCGQADARGDFKVPLTRLPPLPESVSDYSATLRLRGSATASPDEAADPDNLTALALESLSTAGVFDLALSLAIRVGELRRVNSFNKTHIAVQTA